MERIHNLLQKEYERHPTRAIKLTAENKNLMQKVYRMETGRKIYPNDPCPCGSGKKYKKCYGRG